MGKLILNSYHSSLTKKMLDIVLSVLLLLTIAPLIIAILFIVLIFNGSPIFFIQKRIGKNGKVFKIFKFRTMVKNAAKYQMKYKKMNESDGPVFKINNDPRFTTIGKILSKTGLDELPQFLNVIKGEMSIVGPRPLPVDEAKKLSKKQKIREMVKPGITSLWVIKGQHKLNFKEWMELDAFYVKNASLYLDIKIIKQTFLLMFKFLKSTFVQRY